MFGTGFYNFVREDAPELWNLEIKIGGDPLPLSNYDRINALAIRNGYLAGGAEKIAVFNLPGTLSDLLGLIAAGLASYMDASGIGTRAAKTFEPKPGDLVYFEGKIVRFMGWEDDRDGSGKKFVLANEDKWKTKSYLPASQIGSVHKYSGARQAPDASDSKSKIAPVRKTIANILCTNPEKIRLADYSATAVCLANPALLDLLKETTINGAKFFELFPSVKWTVSGEHRLGRDHKKRSYLFYFTGSLSSTDDLLRSLDGQRIRNLITEAGRASRFSTTLASMESDYALEKVWVLGEANDIASTQKMQKSGFKTWVWTTYDFSGANDTHENFSEEIDHADVSAHLEALRKACNQHFEVAEVSYPASFAERRHVEVQEAIRILKEWNNNQKNPSVDEFLASSYGLLNKIFQVPFPPSVLGHGTQWSIASHFDSLKIKAAVASAQLPELERGLAARMIELIDSAIPLFLNHPSKYEIVRNHATGGNCLVVKRRQFAGPLEELLSGKAHAPDAIIAMQPLRTRSADESLVWTFRPNFRQFIEGLFTADKTVFIGYPLQCREWDAITKMYDSRALEFCNPDTRADILKIDAELFEPLPHKQNPSRNLEVFAELESKLLAPRLFLGAANYGEGGEAGGGVIVSAKQIAFEGGFNAFLETDKMVKLVDPDGEGIIQKDPDQLAPGDKVVFLKDERSTVFEELVEYYGHRSEVVELLKLSEAWREALKKYCEANNLDVSGLRAVLQNVGLDRTEASLENWLSGRVICPPEKNYFPIDVIAAVTKDTFLSSEKERVKDAARKVHSMRIKIGRYLARRIVQSAASGSTEDRDDPVLAGKLDKISSYAEVAVVEAVSPDTVQVPTSIINRLLGTEDF